MTASDDSSTAPNAFRLDRRAVRRAFDQASSSYDAAAHLQATVRTELLERLQWLKCAPDVVLDAGAGTGAAMGELARIYPTATLVGVDLAFGMARKIALRNPHALAVCGDAFSLPLRAGSVQLIFSNLLLQWCDDLDLALAELRRVLAPGGLLLFATLGPDTLHELRRAWSAADGHEHVSRFLDMHDIGSALSRAGFQEPVLDVDRLTLHYPQVLDLMRNLKAIGARNATASRTRGLTSRSRLARVQAAYENERREGLLPATYEVVYATAWAPQHAPQNDDEVTPHEIWIAIESIRRRNNSG